MSLQFTQAQLEAATKAGNEAREKGNKRSHAKMEETLSRHAKEMDVKDQEVYENRLAVPFLFFDDKAGPDAGIDAPKKKRKSRKSSGGKSKKNKAKNAKSRKYRRN
jgi:hypothetical protein